MWIVYGTLLTKSQILLHTEGYYIFKYQVLIDKDQILQSGPYICRNKPLIHRKWELNFTFTYDLMSIILLWVKFPGLAVGYWTAAALRKVASVVGKPLYTDKWTAQSKRISYGTILIEVDVAQKLPDEVEIDTSYGVLKQHIQYDWTPFFCNEFLIFGHESDDDWYKEPR